IVLVSACVTYPPPKMEGNRYQNYRHGFVIELPGEPWVVTDKPPARFESSMGASGYHRNRARKLLLTNNQTNALIAVHCWRSTDEFKRHILSEAMSMILEMQKKEALKSEAVTRFDYNVYFKGLDALAWTVNMDFETPIQRIQLISKNNAYPIGDDTHVIEITLFSDRLTFDENYGVFDKMYKSFEWGEHLMEPTTE
ncbi:MAG: hypothetical protein PVI73_08410, partial [Syntrophobacterales bacterium]